MNKKNNEILNDNDSIDLIEIFSNLWKSKILIIKTTLIFTVIGIIYALSIKNTYTASSTFYPHFDKSINNQNEGLAGLAGLAGINLRGETSGIIPTTLYPKIISSPQFKIDLLDSKVNFNENKLSYREYLLNKEDQFNLLSILTYPIYKIYNLINYKNTESKAIENDILSLTNEEFSLHKKLSSIISLELNNKEGFINLSVIDEDPVVASQIAITSNNILQNSIIDFKIKNINNTYEFINSQLEIAKKNFYNLQDSLAVFNDRNKNIKSDVFLNTFTRIESEYLIAKNIYNELSINKQKTAIDVKRNTPIFTIIKPVVKPNTKSGPNRSSIVAIFLFSGFLISSSYAVTKNTILIILKKIRYK